MTKLEGTERKIKGKKQNTKLLTVKMDTVKNQNKLHGIKLQN